jgi:VWFA-related protein
VNAGPDQGVTLPTSALLAGTVTDDGLPNPPGALTITWSKFSGPSSDVVFSPNATAENTTASFYEAGTYVLRLSAEDGGGTVVSDDVTVTVSPVQRANRPPAVNAGTDQAVALSATALLNGTVTDDGLPNPPGAVATTWSKVSGPVGTVNFGDPNAVDTTADFSGPGPGTYVLSLTANDGEFVVSDNVTITVIDDPNPNISLLPEQTDFGVVVLGESADKNIEIRNTGNLSLTIGDPITLTNPATDPFSVITDNCTGAVIPPSSNCGLTIRFAPTTQDNVLGSLDIPSDDPDALTVTATLAGKGRALNTTISNSVVLVAPGTVQLTVSVSDQFGVPVTTLLAGNFDITENGSPITITNTSNTVNSPLSVGMVLDYSSSTIPVTLEMEAAAKSFVDELNPVTDEAEVIKFDEDIAVMQVFTENQDALKAAIDAPPPNLPRDGTHLYEALWQSINSTSLRSNPQLAIIAVSDGEDSSSTSPTIEDVTAAAASSNVQIFTIGIGNVDNTVMQQLATETGGQYFFAPNISDLEAVYAAISKILSNQYTIEYTPTTLITGEEISLTVVVTDGAQLGEDSITTDLQVP